MHGIVGAVVAGVGIVAEEVDPTVQPVRQSFYAFLFLGVATILLILSFLRHLRRAQSNLGPASDIPAAPPEVGDGSGADRGTEADSTAGRAEGDPR